MRVDEDAYLDELVEIKLPRGCWLDLYDLLIGFGDIDNLKAFKLFEENVEVMVK